MFFVRIFSVDHYMTSPILGLDPTYSHFRGKEVKQVPVLRIFGANQTGHKTCLHVHGVFPYLHIPHDETSTEATERLCYRVATSLDKAINILMGQSDSNMQHVFDVTPVAGVPLYGYHNRKHQYLKIRFFNPFSIKKAATLFQNGTILDRIYQPHDAHINYELQFMIDFNLHGMNNMYLTEIKYRIDHEIDASIINEIPSQNILNEKISRMSTCQYEIDCLCEHIINLQEVTSGKLSANPGIASIWEEERHRRQLQNKDTQDIAPTESQFRSKIKDTTSEIFFKSRLKDRLESLKSLQYSNVSSLGSLNQSIYPLEVSEQSQFLNASIAHLIQNPEVSLTPNFKDLNESVVNENLILSLTQEDKNQPKFDDIYNALIDLIDEDSILSQNPLNEHEVIQQDEIEQESHDLEQTLIEDSEIFSSNEIKNNDEIEMLSHELEPDLIHEIFPSNDSFLKLESTLVEYTDNYSDDTLIESEKQYSVFYDDVIDRNNQISFSQFSDDILDSTIANEMLKIENNLSHEESIIFSSDSEELVFDGKWKKIPQIDGNTSDLNKKPKRKYIRRSKKLTEPEVFGEMLCETTGTVYKIEPVLPVEKKQKRKYVRKNTKNQLNNQSKSNEVKILKIEENNINIEQLTQNLSYMPISLQNNNNNIHTAPKTDPNSSNFGINMPVIDEPIENILNQDDCEMITQHYDDMLKEFDHFLTHNYFDNTFENVSEMCFQNYDIMCIKGLLSEMINAIAPDETYEIFPESSCKLYHEMYATFSDTTIPIDIQCRFLQNIREHIFQKMISPNKQFQLNYVLQLNRDLIPIAIDAYDKSRVPNTKTIVLDKEKFTKSLIYDDNIEITDTDIILYKNGKIIVKKKDPEISDEKLLKNITFSSQSIFQRSKSCNEFCENKKWKNVKFNIKEGHPWKSRKVPHDRVKIAESLPTSVSSKLFDAKLREFLTNSDNSDLKTENCEEIERCHSETPGTIRELLKLVHISQDVIEMKTEEPTNVLTSKSKDDEEIERHHSEIPGPVGLISKNSKKPVRELSKLVHISQDVIEMKTEEPTNVLTSKSKDDEEIERLHSDIPGPVGLISKNSKKPVRELSKLVHISQDVIEMKTEEPTNVLTYKFKDGEEIERRHSEIAEPVGLISKNSVRELSKFVHISQDVIEMKTEEHSLVLHSSPLKTIDIEEVERCHSETPGTIDLISKNSKESVRELSKFVHISQTEDLTGMKNEETTNDTTLSTDISKPETVPKDLHYDQIIVDLKSVENHRTNMNDDGVNENDSKEVINEYFENDMKHSKTEILNVKIDSNKFETKSLGEKIICKIPLCLISRQIFEKQNIDVSDKIFLEDYQQEVGINICSESSSKYSGLSFDKISTVSTDMLDRNITPLSCLDDNKNTNKQKVDEELHKQVNYQSQDIEICGGKNNIKLLDVNSYPVLENKIETSSLEDVNIDIQSNKTFDIVENQNTILEDRQEVDMENIINQTELNPTECSSNLSFDKMSTVNTEIFIDNRKITIPDSLDISDKNFVLKPSTANDKNTPKPDKKSYKPFSENFEPIKTRSKKNKQLVEVKLQSKVEVSRKKEISSLENILSEASIDISTNMDNNSGNNVLTRNIKKKTKTVVTQDTCNLEEKETNNITILEQLLNNTVTLPSIIPSDEGNGTTKNLNLPQTPVENQILSGKKTDVTASIAKSTAKVTRLNVMRNKTQKGTKCSLTKSKKNQNTNIKVDSPLIKSLAKKNVSKNHSVKSNRVIFNRRIRQARNLKNKQKNIIQQRLRKNLSLNTTYTKEKISENTFKIERSIIEDDDRPNNFIISLLNDLKSINDVTYECTTLNRRWNYNDPIFIGLLFDPEILTTTKIVIPNIKSSEKNRIIFSFKTNFVQLKSTEVKQELSYDSNECSIQQNDSTSIENSIEELLPVAQSSPNDKKSPVKGKFEITFDKTDKSISTKSQNKFDTSKSVLSEKTNNNYVKDLQDTRNSETKSSIQNTNENKLEVLQQSPSNKRNQVQIINNQNEKPTELTILLNRKYKNISPKTNFKRNVIENGNNYTALSTARNIPANQNSFKSTDSNYQYELEVVTSYTNQQESVDNDKNNEILRLVNEKRRTLNVLENSQGTIQESYKNQIEQEQFSKSVLNNSTQSKSSPKLSRLMKRQRKPKSILRLNRPTIKHTSIKPKTLKVQTMIENSETCEIIADKQILRIEEPVPIENKCQHSENTEKVSKRLPTRRAKLIACDNIASSVLALNRCRPLRKKLIELNPKIIDNSVSTQNQHITIKEIPSSVRIQDVKENINDTCIHPKTKYFTRSQKSTKFDLQVQSSIMTTPIKHEKIPGIDGIFYVDSSSEDYSTDSTEENSLLMEEDILFVDGLNDNKKISSKHNLCECSVILPRLDYVNSTNSFKRKLRSRKEPTLTPKATGDQSNVGTYTPLDVILTKSPTSRNLKEKRERIVTRTRKRLRLNFDDQEPSTSKNIQETQRVETCNLNLVSSSEIEEIQPPIGTGEFSVQHFEPQSLESSKERRIYETRMKKNLNENNISNLKHNQNDKNVIQNACDNDTSKCNLVNNSISDNKSIRKRSLRNRTLISETKKIIENSPSISNLTTSTPINTKRRNRRRPKKVDTNNTFIEENKECSLNQSPKLVKKLINVSQIPNKIEEEPTEVEQNVADETSDDDHIISCSPDNQVKLLISPRKSQDVISKVVEGSNSAHEIQLSLSFKKGDTKSQNVVSKVTIKEKSIDNEVQVSVAPKISEKEYTNAYEYDKKNNFFPQPGCSTVESEHEMLIRHLQDLEDLSPSPDLDRTICMNLRSPSIDTNTSKSKLDNSQVFSDDCEKSGQELSQTSECEVESLYDVTFADCTRFEENSNTTSTLHCAQNNNEFDHKSQSTEMRLSCLSFTSDSNLTPNRLREKLAVQNLSTIQFNNCTNRLTTDGFVVLMPKFNPPTYNDIKNSLLEYGIPEVKNENPFYSIASDATGRIEIGHKILKIPTKCVQDLPEFTSELEFDSIAVWRKRKLDTIQNVQGIQCLATNREVLITPNLKPPSLKDVQTWLKAKKYLKEKEKCDKPFKIKIKIPCSPGGNDDNSDNESLTLTPCTPKVLSTPTGSFIKTPSELISNLSNKQSQSPSIVHKSAKHILKNKRIKIALAKSFGNKTQPDESVLQTSVANLFNHPQDLNSPNTFNNSSCLISGATLDNTHGFKVPLENFQDVKAMVKHQYLTTMILELHIKTRSDFKPNPQLDPIVAIFYSIYNDVPLNYELPQSETGIICVGSDNFLTESCNIIYVDSELQLFEMLVKLFAKWDPDILAGYEISRLSWGFLFERSFHLKLNLPKKLSRIPESRSNTRLDENGQMSDINLTGRLFLEIWRLMRHEINLYSYSFENVFYHILHERIPKHSFKNLTTWFESNFNRYITVKYYLKRVTGVLSLLDQLDFIGRTSELARLFGIQFYEVLSRGSQFRVESMMLRLTKPLNYIPVSPSVTQRAKMKAPEFLPLIMEPDSRLYTDPIIVLDFQSLYPSMIIAYNYCFSTCLGRVSELGQAHPFEFGATQLRVNPKLVESFLNSNKLNISPCGVAFVNDSVRLGILPRMLKEILDCRLMVKKSLKENKDDATLKRVLNSRQLGLKLIANVTYGYTAANFSGRMPCCELADSVVSKGRETLERAIQMVEKNEKWKAKVVYGDTDSLFVMTPGRSRKDAFQIGKEIAEAVTNDNPTPVKLKLEKIYQPCILQTKKRYVGYMYESPDQEEPVYNAKGIETVRRDGCPAVAKILEKTLKILFDTKDMSLVKQYVCRQFSKIITGRVNMQDLIFAREFRGSSGYRPGAMVPALELSRRYKLQDPRSEPLRSERVPYIIASGAPGTTLVRLAKGPHELIADSGLKPHIQYYITKVIIPPLNRCLSLCGVDVHTWYKDLPRKYKLYFPTADTLSKDGKKSTIAQHFATTSCVSCGVQTREVICSKCIDESQKTVIVLQDKLRKWERTLENIKQICSSCCGRFEETHCISLDCPVLYRLTQAQRDYEQTPFVRNALFNKIVTDTIEFPVAFTNSAIDF